MKAGKPTRVQGTGDQKRYRWEVQIDVDAVWVADGFNLTEERLRSMVGRALAHAYGHEFAVKVLRAPPEHAIAIEQGADPEAVAAAAKPDARAALDSIVEAIDEAVDL